MKDLMDRIRKPIINWSMQRKKDRAEFEHWKDFDCWYCPIGIKDGSECLQKETESDAAEVDWTRFLELLRPRERIEPHDLIFGMALSNPH